MQALRATHLPATLSLQLLRSLYRSLYNFTALCIRSNFRLYHGINIRLALFINIRLSIFKNVFWAMRRAERRARGGYAQFRASPLADRYAAKEGGGAR